MSIFANAQQNTPSNVFQTLQEEVLSNSKNIDLNSEEFTVKKEEKVVLSIINFGRINPFKPYKALDLKKFKKAKKKKNKKEESGEFDYEELPYPPTYSDELVAEINVLTQSTVNGILYDPYARSVAIVSIEGSDYMLHKGDTVRGITVAQISEKEVTLKYNSNMYTVGVGEIIDGTIQHEQDIIERKDVGFGGSSYRLPDIEPED